MVSPPRVHKLVHLLTLVSTVSALSLANFQIVISNAIPSTCIRAYSRRIPGCFIRDFRGGSMCSSKCTNGLVKAEARIEAACSGVDVNRDTLLGIALRGDLVATLCPGVVVAPSPTTVTVTVPARTSTTQSSSTPTLPAPSPPSSPPAPPAPPSPLPPALTTRTTLSTSTAAGTTPPRSTSTPEATSPSAPTTTQPQTSVVETTTAAPPPSSATPTGANTPLPQTTAAEPSRPNGGGRPPLIGGGGSPFDQPVIGRGRSTYTVCWAEAIWAALGATLILLC